MPKEKRRMRNATRDGRMGCQQAVRNANGRGVRRREGKEGREGAKGKKGRRERREAGRKGGREWRAARRSKRRGEKSVGCPREARMGTWVEPTGPERWDYRSRGGRALCCLPSAGVERSHIRHEMQCLHACSSEVEARTKVKDDVAAWYKEFSSVFSKWKMTTANCCSKSYRSSALFSRHPLSNDPCKVVAGYSGPLTKPWTHT